MAKKVTKGNTEKSNPVTDEFATTQYARAEHSNPVTEEFAQTQYARVVNENLGDVKTILNSLDKTIKESFPDASDDVRANLIAKLIDRIK